MIRQSIPLLASNFTVEEVCMQFDKIQDATCPPCEIGMELEHGSNIQEVELNPEEGR